MALWAVGAVINVIGECRAGGRRQGGFPSQAAVTAMPGRRARAQPGASESACMLHRAMQMHALLASKRGASLATSFLCAHPCCSHWAGKKARWLAQRTIHCRRTGITTLPCCRQHSDQPGHQCHQAGAHAHGSPGTRPAPQAAASAPPVVAHAGQQDVACRHGRLWRGQPAQVSPGMCWPA